MLVVTKFGGSSVSSSKQFAKIKKIIESNPLRKIVVVSALGKRNSNDYKITDLLFIVHAHLKYGVSYDSIWQMIYDRFVGIRDELKLTYPIEDDLNEIKNNLNKNTNEDYLVSRGEYLTAKLMSAYLGFKFVDSKDNIIFDYNGEIDYTKTDLNLKNSFDSNGIVVPGFYGAFPDGSIKLLSRGGSDVTGSILAKCLNASLYENWTDVSGIMMADPRIVDNPRIVPEITYQELRELSYMGANVLHDETIFPIEGLNIPINLKNTNEPDAPGTLIKREAYGNNILTGIAGKKGFTSITIYKRHLSKEIGFMRKCLEVFEKYNISIEHTPTGIDIVNVIVNSKDLENIKNQVIAELTAKVNPDSIKVLEHIAFIACVGRNFNAHYGVSSAIFSALNNEHINVSTIIQGPEELNIIVGVAEKDYEKAIRALYNALVNIEIK